MKDEYENGIEIARCLRIFIAFESGEHEVIQNSSGCLNPNTLNYLTNLFVALSEQIATIFISDRI